MSEDSEALTIDNTPFAIVREKELWYVLLGTYRLSAGYPTIKEAVQDAERDDWDRRLSIFGVMIENYNKNKKDGI